MDKSQSKPTLKSNNNGQSLRRSARLKVSEEEAPPTITDKSVNQPTINAEAGVQAKKIFEQAPGESLKILIPSKKSREAKAHPPKPPLTINAGPVTVTVRVKLTKEQEELKRKQVLDNDVTCLLVTNSKNIVYCRPCKISIQLEQKSPSHGGYYGSAWKRHSKTDNHKKNDVKWKAQGGDNVPKDQDQQWKAELASGKRSLNGAPKASYNLVKVEGANSSEGATTSREVAVEDDAVAVQNSEPEKYTPLELMGAGGLLKLSSKPEKSTPSELMVAEWLLKLSSQAEVNAQDNEAKMIDNYPSNGISLLLLAASSGRVVS